MSYFDANVKKVSKINAPLLVIGFGGSGADGVLRVKHEFSQRFVPDRIGETVLDRPPRTAYIVLDTDPNVVKKSYRGTMLDGDSEFVNLQADLEYLLDDNGHNLNPNERSWLDESFYKELRLRKEAATDGAGTYRQLSRLMLFRQASAVYGRLVGALTQLATLPAGSPPGARKINVVMITGLSGGTGSGTFLDTAYLLRHAAKQTGQSIVCDLYALSPDLTIAHHASSDTNKQTIYQTNSFAALKELDYWMNVGDRMDGGLEDSAMQINYGNNLNVCWDCSPFDTVTLLCATNADGTLIQDAYQVVLSAFAETLMFMYADEANKNNQQDIVGVDQSTENDSFSFQSARSNEYAYLNNLPHPYPERYHYRAIGAYSNLGEQRNRISIESSMLFNDIKAFYELPSNLPAMKGTAPEEFFQAAYAETATVLYNEFVQATAVPTELFSNLPPYSKKDLRVTPSEELPHQQPFARWNQLVETYVGDQAESFEKRLYEGYQKAAAEYIQQKGPKAFQRLLTDENNGFLTRLKAKGNELENMAGEDLQAHIGVSNAAEQEYKDWQGTNTLQFWREGPLFEAYIQAAQSKFETKQQQKIHQMLGKAVEALEKELRANAVSAVEFTLQALETVRAELEADVQQIAVGPQNGRVVSLDTIKQQIRDTYNLEDNKNRLLHTALLSISECIASGGKLRSRQEAADKIIDSLQVMMDTIFQELNDMTLSAQLQKAQVANNSDAVMGYAKKTLAPMLERGAQVNFALSPSYTTLTNHNAVLTSYISIPAGQDDIRNGIKEYIATSGQYSGAVLKNSMISDRVFWLNIHSGLPLCAYRFLGDYERVYEANCAKRPGVHLLMTNRSELDNIRYNWQHIPSPHPFMLFTSGGNAWPVLSDRRKTVNETLECAEKNGLLVLNANCVDPNKSTAAFTWLLDADGQRMTEEMAESVMTSMINLPPEGAKNELEILKGLKADIDRMFSSKAAAVPMQLRYIEERLAKFANDQGVADHQFEAKDPAAIEACFRAYIYYEISKRPLLVEMLDKQNRLFAKKEENQNYQTIRNRIETIEHASAEFADFSAAVIAASKRVAELWLFGLVDVKLNKVTYVDELDEVNDFFLKSSGLHAQEAWGNLMPLIYSFTEYIAQMDPEKEPLPSLKSKRNAIMKEIDDADVADTQMMERLKGYWNKAQDLTERLKKQIVLLKRNQQDITDARYYQLALKTLEHISTTMENMTTEWENI